MDYFKYLAGNVTNINQQNSSGKTPLHLSMRNGSVFLPILVENGADPQIEDNAGLTVIDYCTIVGKTWPWNCDALKELFPDEYSRIERERAKGETP